MKYHYNDGGRSEAGYKGVARDCGVRAIAIVADISYKEAYKICNEFCSKEKPSKSRRGKSSSRTGIHTITYRKILNSLGFEWTPTMKIGSGCRVLC